MGDNRPWPLLPALEPQSPNLGADLSGAIFVAASYGLGRPSRWVVRSAHALKEFAGLTSLRRTLTLALAQAAVMCARSAGASAVELDCGAIITEDTVLTEDILCGEDEGIPSPGPDDHWNPPEYALSIRADGATLDLNVITLVPSCGGVANGIGVFRPTTAS